MVEVKTRSSSCFCGSESADTVRLDTKPLQVRSISQRVQGGVKTKVQSSACSQQPGCCHGLQYWRLLFFRRHEFPEGGHL